MHDKESNLVRTKTKTKPLNLALRHRGSRELITPGCWRYIDRQTYHLVNNAQGPQKRNVKLIYPDVSGHLWNICKIHAGPWPTCNIAVYSYCRYPIPGVRLSLDENVERLRTFSNLKVL